MFHPPPCRTEHNWIIQAGPYTIKYNCLIILCVLVIRRDPSPDMQINLKQLEAFRAVMQTGSTNEAASFLNISQPAVSRSIKNLEAQIDFSLFIRQNGRLHPTAEAEDLFREINDFYQGVDHLANVLGNIRLVGGGHLRIVCSMPMGQSLLPDILRDFRAMHPDLSVSVRIVVKREMQKWLESQLFDVAMLTLPVEYPEAHYQFLAEVELVCILPKGHRLCDAPFVRAEDLYDEEFISIVPETELRLRVDRAFAQTGLVRQKMRIETQSAASICQFVARGLGVSIIDPYTAAAFEETIVIRPFRPAIKYSSGAVLPIHRPVSRRAEEFIELIRDSTRRFVSDRRHYFDAGD